MYNLKYADYDGIYHGFNLKKDEKGMTFNEWDNSDFDSRMEIESEYDYYYYDELPEFVIAYLNNRL